MTTAPKPDAVTLTDAEQALYAKLADLDANEHGARLAALQAAADLTRSLRDRNAIPQVRVLWFTDPAHNIGGRGKSRLQVFEGNGTRGAAMLNGAEAVKIHGEYVPVRAEVTSVPNLSGHADYTEILDWLGRFAGPPRQVFVTHGEPAAADALRQRIAERFGWTVRVPEHRERVTLA